MRQIFLSLAFFVLCPGSVAAQTDEAAIQQAIESESRAYHTNPDRGAYMRYWHVTTDARLVYSAPDASVLVSGKDMQQVVASGQFPPMDNAKTVYYNFVIRASGNVGWAFFDQETTLPDGNVSYLHEFRCMEKVDGAWKIVGSSVHLFKQ